MHPNGRELKECHSSEEALERITELYAQSVQTLQEAFDAISKEGSPSPHPISEEISYPYVGIHVTPENLNVDARLSYGVVIEPGTYGTTVTRPDLFGHYYKRQIDLLIKHHQVPVVVGKSNQPIPLPFVVEQQSAHLDQEQLWQLQLNFPWPNIKSFQDDIADNLYQCADQEPHPLALFSGERTDYSLHRLDHYTGTSSEHFQGFVLLTNYQRYIQEFIDYSLEELRKGGDYTAFVQPGNHITPNPTMDPRVSLEGPSGALLKNLPQMPAYHLKRADRKGITFINIGVGPSNAKTITDHLAVLRPHCWLMLGHCGGLRQSQLLGDYVLAHGYAREDHVLDADLPTTVSIPALAEIQVALQEAVVNVTGLKGRDLKTRMRTGTVMTTDNRNWELRSQHMMQTIKQSRAIAMDMESATVAANGFRFRVPYGTLLCVSDKPIHGQMKFKTMAGRFYEERVHQHLKIGLETIRLLRESGTEDLHSRKLRGFEEAPFR